MAPNIALISTITLFFILSHGYAQSEFASDSLNLRCMPGIPRFSSKKSQSHYYQCDAKGIPELMECPEGKHYHTKTQKCLDKSEARKEEQPVKVEALGRNFQLGSLYDGRKAQFYPEASLWSPEVIAEEATVETDNGDVSIQVNAEKTAKEKMDHMGVSASLTLYFMGGIISVTGSGGYIKDSSTRDDEVSIGLSYKEITHTKRLTRDVNQTYGFECENPLYTHVVTEVQYGLGANFEFRRVFHKDENQEVISGHLELSINLIPGFSITGGASVNLSDYEMNLLNSTSLKMYGDFSPNGDYLIPTTYIEAVDFYSLLPLMSGNEASDFNGTSIMSATLTPITLVCPNAEFNLNDINNEIMEHMIKMLDEIEQINMKLGGLFENSASQKYLPLRGNLNLFKVKFERYRLDVKGRLQDIIPNIRGGNGHGEEDLNRLWSEYLESPFEYFKASQFLGKRKREINSIESITLKFPIESNIAVVDFESANDVRYIYSFKNVLILELHVLTPSYYMESYLNGTELSEDNFWYNDDDTLGDIAFQIHLMTNFALDNVDQEGRGYLVNLLPVIGQIGDGDPWKVKALVTGNLITDNFIIPEIPEIKDYYEVTHNSFKFLVKKQSEFVTGCKVYIKDLFDGGIIEQVKMIKDDIPAGDDVEIVVDNLTPNHIYSFTVKLVTVVGTSPPSEEENQLITLSASPPERFSAKEVTRSSVKLEWGPPHIMAEGLTQQDFQYKIVQTDENGNPVTKMTEDFETIFSSLMDASQYSYEIRAVIKKDIGEGEGTAAYKSIFSSPLPPTMHPSDQIWEHRATVSWDPPAKLPNGSLVLHYILNYSTEGASQDNAEEIIVENPWCDVTDLAQDQQYQFKVKIVTSEGSSNFSPLLKLTTSFSLSDLDKLKEDIRDNVLMPMLTDVEEEQSKQLSVCAYQENLGVSEKDQVVPFSETYLEKNDFSSGSLFGQGFFIPPVAGTYQFSYKVGQAKFSAGDGVHIFKLFKNSDTLKESWSLAKVENANALVPLSGTILMQLFQGDMVMLVHESQNDPKETAHITLCIQLLSKE